MMIERRETHKMRGLIRFDALYRYIFIIDVYVCDSCSLPSEWHQNLGLKDDVDASNMTRNL